MSTSVLSGYGNYRPSRPRVLGASALVGTLCVLVCIFFASPIRADFPPALNVQDDSVGGVTMIYGQNGNYSNTNSNGNYVAVSISSGDGSGTTSMSVSTYDANGSQLNYQGYYNFSDGSFGGVPVAISSVNTDGSPWSPTPPPPPSGPSCGPAGIRANGETYSWTSTGVSEDVYSNGYQSITITFQYVDSYTPSNNPLYNVTSTFGVSGHYEPATEMFDVSNADVRAEDANGNIVYPAGPPDGFPWAIRVDSAGNNWRYLGTSYPALTSTLRHYAGNAGERISIDQTGVVSLISPTGPATGVFDHGVIWGSGRDLRALMSPQTSSNWGPPAVQVNGVAWQYFGTWNTNSSSSNSQFTPSPGDYYAGVNTGQFLRVQPDGSVDYSNIDGLHETGSYSGTDHVFAGLSGTILALDPDGNPYQSGGGDGGNGGNGDGGNGDGGNGDGGNGDPPLYGPPAIWVNGIIFSLMTSSGGVLAYGDAASNSVQIDASGARGISSNGTQLWSGVFYPSPTDPWNSGVFVTNNWMFDVRACNGNSPLQAGTAPEGRPAKISVNGAFWTFVGHLDSWNDPTSGYNQPAEDYYLGANPGERLLVDSDNNVAYWTDTASQEVAAYGFLSGTVFVGTWTDLRALNSNNTAQAPQGSPSYGPAGVWVNELVWIWLGTVNDSQHAVYADYYGGPNVGQILSVNSSGQVSVQNTSGTGLYTLYGTYSDGIFAVSGADVRALGSDGHYWTQPSNGQPETLRIGGLHWRYLGSSGGIDYYAADRSGQRLAIDSNGSVTYSDYPHNIAGATGTYANGTFVAGSGGTTYNAGTIGGDLDILGNLLSLGSLDGDRNTAGLTISFTDDQNTHFATVGMTSSRMTTDWLWSRAHSPAATNAVDQMRLDSANRIFLYDPTNPSLPPTILDPRGQSSYIPQQGDLSMGEFTHVAQ